MELNRRIKWKSYVIGGCITALWLVMMASLLYRHVLPHKRAPLDGSAIANPAELTQHWQDTHEHMLLMFGKAIIGAASTVVQKLDSPQTHYVANFRLGASFGFTKLKQSIAIKAVGELDSKFELTDFYVDAALPAIRLRVRGATKGTELFLDVEKNGQHALSRLHLGRRISLLEAVRPALMQQFAVKPGASYVLPVADPLFSMQQGQVEIRVLQRELLPIGGRQIAAYKVEIRLNDFVSYIWVNRQGETLRRQIIGNLTMENTSEAEAKRVSPVLTEARDLPPLDLVQFKRVPSKSVEQMSDGKQSPLAILGGLLNSE